MRIFEEMIRHFSELFPAIPSEELFAPAKPKDLDALVELFGGRAERVIEFYRQYEPQNLPMLPCYAGLCDIAGILAENRCETGQYLAACGVFVIGTTVGGGLICIDTNEEQNGDPSVRVMDHSFTYYDEETRCAKIFLWRGNWGNYGVDVSRDGTPEVTPANIQRYSHRLSESFTDFFYALSVNQYEDIEEYV